MFCMYLVDLISPILRRHRSAAGSWPFCVLALLSRSGSPAGLALGTECAGSCLGKNWLGCFLNLFNYFRLVTVAGIIGVTQ